MKEQWLEELKQKLTEWLGERLFFLGIQGSYKRGEATAESDIDIVLILDRLELEDLTRYRSLIRTMPEWEKVCGFVAGKEELYHWMKSDLFQFCYDTRALYGSLDELRAAIGQEDIRAAVQTGAANLYHAACHSFLFEDRKRNLPELYKMTFFILLAREYLESGVFRETKAELAGHLTGLDREIFSLCREKERLADLSEEETGRCYELLIRWCSGLLRKGVCDEKSDDRADGADCSAL